MKISTGYYPCMFKAVTNLVYLHIVGSPEHNPLLKLFGHVPQGLYNIPPGDSSPSNMSKENNPKPKNKYKT